MKKLDRRKFIRRFFKGAGVALLSLIHGTFFNRTKLLAQEEKESFETVLARTTKTNVYSVLKTSTLPEEEKMAILAVREISREEIKKVLSLMEEKPDRRREFSGFFCGDGCDGEDGFICGNDCKSGSNAIAVLDKEGKLDIDVPLMNKEKFKSSLEKALRLTR